MGILIEKSLGELSLTDLTSNCVREMSKYRRKEPCDDRYCLEVLRRAVILGQNAAWEAVQRLFSENVRLWINRHPHRSIALRHEDEQTYVSDTFRRFWQAVGDQKLTFTSLAGALSYLHLCSHCAIMDTLRLYARPKEEPLPEYGQIGGYEPWVEDNYHQGELWEVIEHLLPGKKEKRVAYLHFHCNLKPREIMRYCPGEFAGEEEIYRLKRNIIERIMRNADKIRWKLEGIPGYHTPLVHI
jgi:hypothetical protein